MIWGQAGWLPAGGQSLEYQTFGPPPSDAPTLVLLHEGLGCTALWRDWPAHLATATGYGVLVYSRAGYGQSEPWALPWPLDYLEYHAEMVLPDIVRPLTSFVLLGHSDGATISAVYAGRVPDQRLKGTVLIAPHFFTEPVGVAAIAAAKQAFDHGDLRAKLAPYHADVDCAFRGWNDSWLHPDFQAWSVREVLETIQIPVLTIQGDQDPYGTVAQVEAVQDRCPGAVSPLILPDVRHAPHVERRDAVNAAIAGFLHAL